MKKITIIAALAATVLVGTSCNDFLDREPITNITPQAYFKAESELQAYLTNYYQTVFNNAIRGNYNAGPLNLDGDTDDMVVGEANTTYYGQGRWLVGAGQSFATEEFKMIRVANYFLQQVAAQQGEGGLGISGDKANINHYIGEAYFMRAYTYFKALVKYGDFPIVKDVMVDESEALIENSVRQPRNEVVKFILSDLDTAIGMLKSGSAFGKVRIGKEAALLFKAHVALFEASFLTYHAGTPRVPGESGWPGAAIHTGKSFNIKADIDSFLSQAMDAAKQVADSNPLVENNHVINPPADKYQGWNPYFEMFSMPDASTVSEVILMRDYNKGQSITQGWIPYIQQGGNNGMTKSLVESFLMANGLPIYADGSGYKGDVSIDDVQAGRDERLQLFMFGESTILRNYNGQREVYGDPGLLLMTEHRDRTGYRPRKYMTYDQIQIDNGINGTNDLPIMRSAEAYLIYMEASYMKNGSIDATAKKYWEALRTRAGVDPDFNKTIAATDLSKEPDLAVYSGSEKVDATLYNIRRERRNEFMGEGYRWEDLKRWRALDATFAGNMGAYIPEGVNLWTEMYKGASYYNDKGECLLVEQAAGKTDANVSSREVSKYLRPYQVIKENNEVWDGYVWKKAYYLQPLGVRDMELASPDGSIANTVAYQNPYWPTEASKPANE